MNKTREDRKQNTQSSEMLDAFKLIEISNEKFIGEEKVAKNKTPRTKKDSVPHLENPSSLQDEDADAYSSAYTPLRPAYQPSKVCICIFLPLRVILINQSISVSSQTQFFF